MNPSEYNRDLLRTVAIFATALGMCLIAVIVEVWLGDNPLIPIVLGLISAYKLRGAYVELRSRI